MFSETYIKKRLVSMETMLRRLRHMTLQRHGVLLQIMRMRA